MNHELTRIDTNENRYRGLQGSVHFSVRQIQVLDPYYLPLDSSRVRGIRVNPWSGAEWLRLSGAGAATAPPFPGGRRAHLASVHGRRPANDIDDPWEPPGRGIAPKPHQSASSSTERTRQLQSCADLTVFPSAKPPRIKSRHFSSALDLDRLNPSALLEVWRLRSGPEALDRFARPQSGGTPARGSGASAKRVNRSNSTSVWESSSPSFVGRESLRAHLQRPSPNVGVPTRSKTPAPRGRQHP